MEMDPGTTLAITSEKMKQVEKELL